MGPRALVVENDDRTMASIEDTLLSIGHDFSRATNQCDARRMLKSEDFGYVLLDLEIPVQGNRGVPRVRNGENLLVEIVKHPHLRGVPVIAMCERGTDSPELAAKAMRLGAADFVVKPFSSSDALDKAINRAIRRQHGQIEPALPSPPPERKKKPRRFAGGELVFFKTYAQLCGVTIITDAGFGQSMKLLEELRRKGRDGGSIPRRGEDLAAAIEADNGINTVTSCMSHLRRNIAIRLLERKGIRCGQYDIIDHNEQGYFLCFVSTDLAQERGPAKQQSPHW